MMYAQFFYNEQVFVGNIITSHGDRITRLSIFLNKSSNNLFILIVTLLYVFIAL